MFRKPKRKGKKESLRKREEDEGSESVAAGAEGGGNEDDDQDTSDLISEARKRLKTTSTTKSAAASASETKNAQHVLATSTTSSSSNKDAPTVSHSDLATRSALHLPTKQEQEAAAQRPAAGRGADGIYRVDAKQNKFLAGPIKASQNIRVTARFDYQPDICKDYQQTGFCGFGDTCIYLHDRGDTVSGWQLEQQWEEEQRRKKEQQEKELNEFMDAGRKQEEAQANGDDTSALTTDDGLPFACHLCREHFKDPIVTKCQHYFCQGCIMDHVRQAQGESSPCPICQKDTHNVFHEPTKLVAKKRRVLGLAQSKATDSWEQFAEALSKKQKAAKEDEGFG